MKWIFFIIGRVMEHSVRMTSIVYVKVKVIA